MQPNLERLIRELRQETCPQRVLDEVRRRTAAPAARPARWRFALPVALAAVVLLCSLAIWPWLSASHGRSPARLTGLAAPARTQVVSQAEDALGLMGRALANAGTRSEKIISDRTVPSLRHSFQITRNKIIHHRDP